MNNPISFRQVVGLASSCRKFVGAHVSASNGVQNAITNSAAVGGAAFGLFLKNQRKWSSPPLTEEQIRLFREHMTTFGYSFDHVLPHGSYLVNLANNDNEKHKKSFDTFLDDLRRCEQLGIPLHNFHPGASVGSNKDECITRIAESLNVAHQKTQAVVTVLENMSRQGTTIGGYFEELASIISQVQNKDRVGVCLDTCHLFAAGYDVRTAKSFNQVLEEFDNVVGLKYLRAMHLNDCKSSFGSHLDRHENIGKGNIGIECFRFIMNDQRFDNIPLILETPFTDPGVYQSEIGLLYSLVDKTISTQK